MATSYLTQPGGGYVSDDKDIQARLIAMGARGASPDSQTQTMAVSRATPGVIVPGATSMDPRGFQTQFQSLTTAGTPSRYNQDGSLNTAAPGSAPVASPASSVPVAQAVSPSSPGFNVNPILSPDEYLTQFGPKKVDEASIREQIRKENQARIDAINTVYDEMVRERQAINEGNLGSVRAMNARGGNFQSDFGNTKNVNQQNLNSKAIGAINAERALQVSSILREVSKLASDEIAAKKAEALGQADAYKKYLGESQQKAQEMAKTLGTAGLSFDEFKQQAPDQLKTLLKNSGYSELELALQMNSAKKSGERIDWKTDVKGNNIIVYGVNPSTGEVEYHTQEIPGEVAGNDVKIVDGELWSISSDGKTASKIGGPGKPQNSDSFTLGEGQVRYDSGGKEIARGPDKVSSLVSEQSAPTSYKEWVLSGKPGTYATWVKKTGDNGRPLTADQAKLIAEGNSLPSVLTPLYEIIDKQSGLFGPTKGRINALNPYNAESQTVEAQLRTAAQTIGKYLEGGVLRKEDETKYSKMLPQLSDTPEVAKNKLKAVDELIRGKQKQYLNDFSSAGFDTTGFSDSNGSTQPSDKLDSVLDSLGFKKESQTSLKGSGSPLSVRNPNPSKIIASATGTYDFTNYATDPNWGKSVRSHLSKIPELGNPDKITEFIKRQAPKSPITGEMVLASAQKFGVDPKLILAIAKQEANFATLGRAARTFNPGNVGNVDSGANINWGSWQKGLDALARNIVRRKIA